MANPDSDTTTKAHQLSLESKTEGRPRLKAVEKQKSKEQLQDSNAAFWARQTLRKITPPTISRKSHYNINAGISEAPSWRSQLKKVDKSENEDVLKPPSQLPPTYSRNLNRGLRTPQKPLDQTSCHHCDPSEASSSRHTTSEHSQQVPCIVVQDEANGKDHVMVSEVNHRKGYSEWEESLRTPSRMRVRDLELSMATKSADDLLAETATGHRTPSILEPLTELPSNNNSTPELHEPKACLPPDHACEWRARCMDLSSEVDALRSEVEDSQSSASVHRNDSVVRSAAQIDVGVGGDLVCEDFGIEGLTIVMHLRGKDDLVINTDLMIKGSPSEA